VRIHTAEIGLGRNHDRVTIRLSNRTCETDDRNTGSRRGKEEGKPFGGGPCQTANSVSPALFHRRAPLADADSWFHFKTTVFLPSRVVKVASGISIIWKGKEFRPDALARCESIDARTRVNTSLPTPIVGCRAR